MDIPVLAHPTHFLLSKVNFRDASVANMTDLINKVTIMMGNVMRILRDEKNFSAEREIRPKKLECNFADQKSWENGVLGKYNIKDFGPIRGL